MGNNEQRDLYSGDVHDFADKLWQAADKLRGPVDAAEYKHVVLGLLFAWGVVAYEWRRGIPSTRGFLLAGLGLVLVVLAAPIDDLWHRLFGLDVTLWSPPHLLALLGSAVSTLGCLLIAVEVYPVRSWTRRAASSSFSRPIAALGT